VGKYEKAASKREMTSARSARRAVPCGKGDSDGDMVMVMVMVMVGRAWETSCFYREDSDSAGGDCGKVL
jgi:hypothetical protein